MSDVRISEHTKLIGGADFEALANSREISMVWLWDMGPKKPEQPKRPKPPVGKEGEPEYDLAMVDFRDELAGYEAALRAFKAAKADFEKWEKDNGGPIERQFWSCDAQDALARDPDRYRVSSRTRGHGRLKNDGLPVGVKPGHGQAEIERRAREGDAEFQAAVRRDPVFGQQEVRQ